MPPPSDRQPQPQAARPPLVTIKTRADFLRIRGGVTSHAPAFLVEAKAARDGAGPPRFGFTATKKLGNAVVRNRIRRRLKEAVRQAQPGLARAGYDYAVVARAPAEHLPFEQLVADMARALKRVHTPRAPKGATNRPPSDKQSP